MIHLRLWWLRVKRNGLRREHQRLRTERGWLMQAALINERDALALEHEIARLQEELRHRRFLRRYAVKEE